MKIKPLVSRTLQILAFQTSASVRRAKSRPVGRILKFHGVGDESYSEADFESNLKFLTSHFSVVRMEEFIDKLAAGKSPANEIVLTFDDGLRNNLTCAYPVLRRLKIPATFFVCPGLIENSRWIWTYEVRARLQFLGAKQAGFIERCDGLKNAGVDEFVDWMKSLSLEPRRKIEADLRELTSDFRPTPEQRAKYDLMNWDEIRSLDPDLITIGSHTVTHPILPGLKRDELSFEISASRKLLEEKLGRPVKYFCYPNGDHDRAAVEEVAKNYRAAVSTEVGFASPSGDLHRLPRIGIAPNLPLLAWRLHRPTA